MTGPASLQTPEERLALLLSLTQAFNSSLDANEVLNRVMDEVIAAMRAERGIVMLKDDAGRLGFKTARGIDQQTIQEPRFQISLSVAERVAEQGDPVMTSDAQSDSRFSMRNSVLNLGLRSILCVPLKIKDKIIGIVYVDNRLQAGIFTRSDLELLSGIASSAAIALENARLYQVAVEKGRMERELQVAHDVQASFLPRHTPDFPDWDFAARWMPARQVAGDYYDFIPQADGRIGLVIADVADKGMPAALYMALTRSMIRAAMIGAHSPSEGICIANQLMCEGSDAPQMFVTLFYGLLDPANGELIYVNAGHNPPLLRRHGANQDGLVALHRTGMLLGVEREAEYTQNAISLMRGDELLLYTDGITEAFDDYENQYGVEKLEEAFLRTVSTNSSDLADKLLDDVHEFTHDAVLSDDITLVVVRRKDLR